MADNDRDLHLGEQVDPATHDRTGEPILYDPAALTTHGVIVGMTGSGKTGLGVVLLEEALLQGIPALVIDPKGDMGNLLLTFPGLTADEFAPWVDPADAEREGLSLDEHAARVAETWRNGLASWGIGPDRLARLRELAELTIYTPGSTAGVGLNLIGDLNAPPTGTDPEAVQNEIEGYVSSLLGMVGVQSDPLSGREHILLANIVHHAWSQGSNLDLAGLLSQIQDPPMRKLGVIDVDTFFPPADRTALALKLNGLLASPSFAGWSRGAPLDIADMLTGGDRTRGAIVSIAHLSDDERQFVVTTVLSKLVTWMRSQSGSADLRTLVYMDEVFGYVPPTAMPPAKKPILTILKQARAFGVGLVLSTQNPVDLDYKAISNAGTWMIGRLQTERDKARLLDGLTSASGEVDISQLDATISGLGKREFLLHSTKSSTPRVFTTRWAMSYLAGPLTRDQISELQPAPPPAPAATTAAAEAAPSEPVDTAPALADDETEIMPDVADGVVVRYLDPAAPWAAEVGAVGDGRRLRAAAAIRVTLLFDETKADLRHEAEWEAIISPLGETIDVDAAIAVDYDDRDLREQEPTDAIYVLPDAKISTKTYFTKLKRAVRDQLYRSETLELFRNTELKLYSRVGESRDEFAQRCLVAADDGADAAAEKIRSSLATKADRIRDAIAKAEDRAREIEADARGRKGDELLSTAGEILGGFLGGRKGRGGLLGGLRRASSKRRQSSKAEERLESAQNRLDEKVDELEDLEAELTETLLDLNEVWDAKAEAIDSYEVGLEKTDISVDDVTLVWVPTD